MKKILLIAFLLIGSLCFSQEKPKTEEKKTTKKTKCKTEVYICDSNASKKYHLTKECGGLKHCKDNIVLICKEKVEKKYGRTLCSFESANK
ncbi:hypothetical protein [Aquimarina algiphila]|uniref:hypothetical protein n=1 Tax=Aquimarina algiphila TaxID=2047982 RepID=UPI00248F72F4|nr:hypothetical protein [Aquimarina algiphila]